MSRYAIVRGDARTHKHEVLALAERNLPGPFEARYAKYYESNPLGAPALFLARDTTSESFVGMAALLPASLRVSGRLVRGGMAGDFAVDESHRGLGPAIPLQKSVLSHLSETDTCFVYGTPNEASERLFHRLGYTDLGRFTRFVKPFRVGFAVRRHTRRPRLAAIASLADPVLALISRERRYRRSGRFSTEKPAMFDARFAALWETAGRQHTVMGERSCELLNWRYGCSAAPGGEGRYSIFALVSAENEAVGYIVFSRRDEIRHVVDIVCLESQAVVDALLSEFLLDAREDGAAAIGVLYLGGSNLLTRRIRAFGFLERREAHGLVAFVPERSPIAVDLLERRRWYFVAGDGDI